MEESKNNETYQELMERYIALGYIIDNLPVPEGVVCLAYDGFVIDKKCGKSIGDIARDLKRIVEDAEAFSKNE